MKCYPNSVSFYELCRVKIVFTEKESNPSFVGYDPAHPTVFLTLFKWYNDPEKVADLMIDLYPS